MRIEEGRMLKLELYKIDIYHVTFNEDEQKKSVSIYIYIYIQSHLCI